MWSKCGGQEQEKEEEQKSEWEGKLELKQRATKEKKIIREKVMQSHKKYKKKPCNVPSLEGETEWTEITLLLKTIKCTT